MPAMGAGLCSCYEKGGRIWQKCKNPDGVCPPRESMCEAITVAARAAGRARFGLSGLQDTLPPWPLGNAAARNGMAAFQPTGTDPHPRSGAQKPHDLLCQLLRHLFRQEMAGRHHIALCLTARSRHVCNTLHIR